MAVFLKPSVAEGIASYGPLSLPRRTPAMQRASELSLVAALFGWPHADGFDSPDQQAPDSWRRDFLAMADAGVWLGLFRSCRSGRDLALSTAPRARLLLNTSKPHAAATWLQRLSSSKLCLSVRGDLPTQFWVR